jgi:hypothetical protein
MRIEFLEEAVEELFEAATWYESKEAGLGVRFRDEIARVIHRITEDPFPMAGTHRRLSPGQLSCFPLLSPLRHSGRKNHYSGRRP